MVSNFEGGLCALTAFDERLDEAALHELADRHLLDDVVIGVVQHGFQL